MKAQDQNTSAFNVFTDSCLSLTKQQVELCRIHYEDMEAQHFKVLAFNVLKDTCPSLTRSWPSSAKGFTTGTRRR